MARRTKARKQRAGHAKAVRIKPKTRTFYFEYYVWDMEGGTHHSRSVWKVKARDEDEAWNKALKMLEKEIRDWENDGFDCMEYADFHVCTNPETYEQYQVGLTLIDKEQAELIEKYW